MEHNDETAPTERKLMSRAKTSGTAHKLRNERRIFNANEAVRSLDLALCRLKKRSAVPNGPNNSKSSPLRPAVDMVDVVDMVHMDTADLPPTSGMDNASVMSMNFSHYELIRNLSRTTNSEGAFSDSTNKLLSPMDMKMKREHLERYFRSAEMWRHARGHQESSSIHFELPEQ